MAISIGNALEWFDLAVYGFLAATIAKLFFPTGNDVYSLLLTLATFGVAFIMRPLGSVVIGAYADRAGRKKALTLSITLMLIGTLAVAVAPTYAQAGLLGSVILVLARLVQGFSAGGEFGSATAFLSEMNPKKRGLYSSWQFASQGLVTIFASAFGVYLSTGLTPEQLENWGWRLPFIFGLLIGPVAIYIRRNMRESEEFVDLSEQGETGTLSGTVSTQRRNLLLSFGLVVLLTTMAYTLLFLPAYAVRQLGLPAAAGFTGTLIMGFIQVALTPVFGAFSDRIGRTPTMLLASLAILVGIIPAFIYLNGHISAFSFQLVLAGLAVAMAAYSGPLAAMMAELFPTRSRGAGLSMSYSFAVAIFGGFAPFIIAWMIELTGSNLAPAIYLACAAAISLVTLISIRRTGHR
ncbi:MFS transporter [Tianweitania sp. BSSL-BM11]|uniref:MFS transporter n=1 Tax=Tianweitania aestuarii TaxID=2814886 RepID=A0ABS5RXU5_9HYPH|nr:MFS transporter [Tianweitania aestuarii]